jgi:hypothetical protein
LRSAVRLSDRLARNPQNHAHALQALLILPALAPERNALPVSLHNRAVTMAQLFEPPYNR